MKIFRYLTVILTLTLFTININAQKWMHEPYLKKTKSQANFYDIKNAFDKYYSEIKDKKKRGTGLKQYKRWEYQTLPKVYPTGDLPAPSKYWDEYVKFKNNNESRSNSGWMPLGLTSWSEFQEGGNPGNGRLNVVTVDPRNKEVLYVGAPQGGLWKSNDGGLTWNTTFDFLQRIGVSSIAIHPGNSNIIFAGTGDRDAFDCKAIGLLRSDDAGATWSSTGFHPTGPNYNNVNKILINPLNPNTMIIGTYYGVYKSRNGGNTWTQVYSHEIKNLKFRPNDTSVIYGCSDVFIRSDNAGNSFTEIAGFPSDISRIEIDVTPANPNLVYALVGKSDNTFEGLYKSSDNGLNFIQRSSTPNILGYDAQGADSSGQAWYDLAIAVSPINENLLYTGGINVWKSNDGGQNFEICTEWYTGSGYNYIHCDIHYMQFFGDTLYVGSDGGVFYTPDNAQSWTDISAGLGITQFYSFGQSETETDMIVGGTQDVGSYLLRNGSWTHVLGGDGMECMIDPNDPDVFYVTYYYGALMKTYDGGHNFNYITPLDAEGGWVTPYQMSKNNSQLIIGGYKDVYITYDGGDNWNTITTNMTGGRNISHLAMGGSTDNYIYASCDNTLYKTTNGGITWDSIVPDPDKYITCIAIDKSVPSRIWLTLNSSYGGKVVYSDNHGNSFTDITGNLANLGLNCIAYDGTAHNGLYLGTETGILYRNDSIGNWVNYNQDLPVVSITKIEVNNAIHKVRASTYGRGIWESKIFSPAGIVESEFEKEICIYPNPANEVVNLEFNSFLPANVSISLINIIGKRIKSIRIDNLTSNKIPINISNLVSGTYFIIIDCGENRSVKKLSVLH